MGQTGLTAVSGTDDMRLLRSRRRLRVRGVVQGVGFRPFVFRIATQLALAGSVANDGDGLTIDVEGEAHAIDELARRLREQAPETAMVESVESEELELRGVSGFEITHSRSSSPVRTLVPPDIATCADCLRELADPADRRYRHPFITCTNCGPRFTIITGLPYDRSATTMARFAMCPACRTEYEDPADRRFHAQSITCPDCGPTLEFTAPDAATTSGEQALRQARGHLSRGAILAVKGLGGYHLACDASNESAVAGLRARKQRGDKPFALMAADMATVQRITAVNDAERALLTGSSSPIVLLARSTDADALVAPSVAPDCNALGVMLPNTPLHHLLFGLDRDAAGPQALVMTSGNVGGEPIVTDDTDALSRLSELADGWLRHDRPIHVPCDDSVTRILDGHIRPLRRSRGYAPLPIALPFEVAPTFAAGADLKNTCALAQGRHAWLSQHIGDLDDLATLGAYDAAQLHLQALTGVQPEQFVVDAHPGYRSSRWARAHADGRPVIAVQHHHAHIASVMAEHGLDADTPVIGLAFDGTGYGDDRAIWGGELLIADYRTYRRPAHLAYVPLAGGDTAVRCPYRMALAHLNAAGLDWAETIPSVAACPPIERRLLRHQFDTGFGCVPTSSMGRLFDAVASLTGLCHVNDFEAQAAIALETQAHSASTDTTYAFGHNGEGRFDAAPIIRKIVADLHAGIAAAEIAGRFHQAVARLVRDLAAGARDDTGLNTVVLGGGVFQNALLIRSAGKLLTDAGFTVLLPTRFPANDGGLALGQLMIAASRRAQDPCA